jgi:hypothetical protein
MSRAHTEIERLARRIATHLGLAAAGEGLAPDQLDDLRACLFGLHTVLRLHFTQEENYFSLARDPSPARAGRRRGRRALLRAPAGPVHALARGRRWT